MKKEKAEIKETLKEILNMIDSEKEDWNFEMDKKVTGINSCGIVTEGKIILTFKE